MVFGSVEQVNNKHIITGSSGINGADLIEAKLSAEKKSVSRMEKDLETNNKKLTAFSEFSALLKEYKKASNALRNPQAFSTDPTSNAFKSRLTSVISSDESNNPASTYATAKAYDGSIRGKHTLEITSLAVAKEEVYTGFTSSSTDVVTGASGFFTAGTFQINGENITLESGDTLLEVAQKINAISATTNTSATIQKISESNYTIRIMADKTGDINAYTITDANNVISQLTSGGIINSSDAVFSFNGQLTTRAENTVSDLLIGDKLEVNLLAPTAGITININIDDNSVIAQDAIINWMNKYNDIMRFAYTQTEFDTQKGNYKDTAILAREIEFTTSIMQITNSMHYKINGLPSSAKSTLGDLGIIISDYSGNSSIEGDTPMKNALLFQNENQALLELALSSDLEEVRKIFAFDYTSTSTNLQIFERSNKLSATTFTVDIDTSRPHITINDNSIQDKVRIIVGADTYRPNFLNGSIIGQTGSPIEGLKMYYEGDGTDNITINLSQGISDRAYNLINELYTSSNTNNNHITIDNLIDGKKQYDSNGNVKKITVEAKGVIDLASIRLSSMNNAKEDSIKNLNDRIERKREILLKEHASNEAKIQKLNNIKQNIEDTFKVKYAQN